MERNFLDFEQPIAELEAKIDELRYVTDDSDINISEEISNLQTKVVSLTQNIFKNLSPWQVSQLARHPDRPYAMDYIETIFDGFDELHGDRAFKDDQPLVGGIAELDGSPVMVVAQQKGRDTTEKVKRNFGMPRPEGYRKALRLFEMAEKFKMPLLTFVDTPGAYPGIGAEERNQSEAIARNLYVLSELKTPIISTIIGEGGSGGALAIAVADRVNMLQYSTYSVISPEGCASILWKDAAKAPEAAESLGITSEKLKALGLIDEIIGEPLGGAHRDPKQVSQSIKDSLVSNLEILNNTSMDKLLDLRYQKLMSFGEFKE